MKDSRIYKLGLLGWLFLVILGTTQAQVTEITLQGTTDNTGVEGDTVTVPVHINTDGLTGENILAFRLEFGSSSDLKPVGFSIAGTAISTWSVLQSDLTNGIALTGAGTIPIAADSTLLLFIDYELQEVTFNRNASYYLNNSGNNYFNEGGYSISMQQGSVFIENKEQLNVSVSPTVLARGDSSTIFASGGTQPYTYSVADTALAEIASGNYVKGLNPGFTTVSVSDANGLSGTSAPFEIRGFRLTGLWPEEQLYQKDTVWMDITTTDLSDLDVLAGRFQMYFNNAPIVATSTTGTLLENASVEINEVSETEYEVAFASSSVIDGAGTLLKVRVVLPSTGSSTSVNFRDDILFNENLRGVYSPKTVFFQVLTPISVTPVGGIPNPLLPGDQIQFQLGGGQAPFTWSLTNPEVGNVDGSGLFTAEYSGTTKVKVTDALGAVGEYSGTLTAFDGVLEVASQVAVFGSEHNLPVTITEMSAGREVFAFDMRIDIDTSRIKYVDVVKTGTLSENATLVVNSNDPTKIRIVGASSTAISGPGELFYFRVALDTAFATGSTPLYPREVTFNEGLPVMSTVNGQIIPGDAPPTTGNTVLTLVEDEAFAFSATDFVYNSASNKPFTSLRIEQLPTNGSLTYFGGAVSLNQVIQISSISSLVYTPPLDTYGDSLANFIIKVGDGDVYSNVTGTIYLSVSSVNDPPRFEIENLVTVNEDFGDTLVTITDTLVNQELGETYAYTIDPPSVSFATVDLTNFPNSIGFSAIADSSGSQVFTITADDGQDTLNLTEKTFTFEVLEVNDTPSIADQVFAIDENLLNDSVIDTLLASDVDSEVTFSITSGNELGAFALNAITGVLTVADQTQLDFETTPQFVLTVQVSDGALTASATVTINLNDIIETPPQIIDQIFAIDENALNGVTVDTIVASDPDGDAITFAVIAGNTGAFAVDVNTGIITVADQTQLDFESTPQFVLTVQVSDGLLTDSASVTINLNDIDETVNQAPQIIDQVFAIDENSLNGVIVDTIAAGDPDGDALTFSITAGNTGAFAVDGNTGVITVADEAQLDFETTPQFVLTVQVSDSALTASATITINLNDVNEAVNQAPQINAQTFAIDENLLNGQNVGTIVATDPDGDALTFSVTAGNTGAFAVNASTGAITVADQAQLDFETTPQFVLTIEVSDSLLSASAAITINLNDVDETVNQAPQISAQTFAIDENTLNGVDVDTIVAADPDGDALTFLITGGNTGAFAVGTNTGIITVVDQAQLDFETTPQFVLTVQVSDGALTASATVTINLNDVNEAVNQAPQINEQTFAIDENLLNGQNVGTIVANDPDGDALTFSVTAGNTGAFAVDANTGAITVADQIQLDFETTPQFVLTVEVSDSLLTASASVTINLNDVDETVNQAPQISAQTFAIDENSLNNVTVGTIIAGDPDGDALTFSVTGGNTGAFAVDANTGVITVADQTQLDFETTPQFVLTVQVSDGALTAAASVTINLNDVNENQAPQIDAQSFAVDENKLNGQAVGTIVATDPDGDILTFSVTAGNTGAFAVDANTGAITVADQAQLDFETTPQFVLTVQVSDGVLTASAAVTINLNDVDETVNQAPQISPQTFAIDENSSNGVVVGTIVAGDPDGDVITFAVITGNTGAFAVDANTGVITVADQTQLDFETTPQFVLSVLVSDGMLIDSAGVTINLNDVNEAVNQAPQINAQTFAIDENLLNGQNVGTIVATDPDGDALTFSITGGDTGAFAVDANTGAITVADQAQLDFETTPQFVLTVQVSDGVLTASASVIINLNDVDETVNQAPQISAQTFAIDENSLNGVTVGTLTAGDPDGDALTFSVTAGNTGAFAVDANTGIITVADQAQLDFETSPQFVLTVQVSDGALTASASVTINLNDVNENQAPQINPQTFAVDENSISGQGVGTIVATDPDGDAITFSVTEGNTGAFAVDANTGVITVADQMQLDFETTPQFVLTVQVSDGVLTASATVIINLNDLDENAAPEISNQTFSLDENSAVSTLVGTITASDPDADVITYQILSGNELSAFASDQFSGELTVADSAPLDFEISPSFVLTVEVSDGNLSASALITINLNDLNENEAPEIQNQTFSLFENSANGFVVGSIVASDPNGDGITFELTGGNTDGAFALNTNNGELTVANSAALDFESIPQFLLNVSVSDGSLQASAVITVNLTDVNENLAPELSNQTFSIAENSPNSTVIGTISASDPDGDALSFTILSGNTSGAVALNGSSGELTVANSEVFDFETTPQLELSIQVSDGFLNASAQITIELTDVNENVLTVEPIKSFNTYPNPVTDRLIIEVASEWIDKNVLIVDINGKVIVSFSLDATNQIDVSLWKEGLYFLQIEGQEGTTRKVIKID